MRSRGISSAMRGPSTINTPSFSRSRLFLLQTKQFFYLYIRCTCNHFSHLHFLSVFHVKFLKNIVRTDHDQYFFFARSGSCGLIATSIFPFLIIPTTLIPRRSLTPRSTRLFPTQFAARRSLPYCNHFEREIQSTNSFDTRLFATRLPISISGYTIRSAPTLCRIAP